MIYIETYTPLPETVPIHVCAPYLTVRDSMQLLCYRRHHGLLFLKKGGGKNTRSLRHLVMICRNGLRVTISLELDRANVIKIHRW